MAKALKPSIERPFQTGDRVKYKTHVSTYAISRISPDGREADIYIPDTEFEIFRVNTEALKWADVSQKK
jgi:hypothetical protein